MAPVNGMEAARYIREHRPQVKTIVLSTYNDKAFITEMLLVGVSGYVLKNATRAEMVDAIHTVMRGKTYFSKEVHENIVSDYVNRVKEKKEQAHENEATLTQRETEIVKLLANEYTNEQIAMALNISYRTVETHRKNIMHKTKAQNLAGLIKYAFSKGII
jgi:DNA-binding NarL/FixJ family response regulator